MLHDDLLAQADALLKQDVRRPKQATLRRVISTAYYAVFHALGYRLSRQIVVTSADRKQLRGVVRRALVHTEMARALTGFAAGNPGQLYGQVLGQTVSKGALREVAATFLFLQGMRHKADYDVNAKFAKLDAQTAVDDARLALLALAQTDKRSKLYEEVFLLSLLLQGTLRGRT